MCVELVSSVHDEVMTELRVRQVDIATGQTRPLLYEGKPKQFHTFKKIKKKFFEQLGETDLEADQDLQYEDRLDIECEITMIQVPLRVPRRARHY